MCQLVPSSSSLHTREASALVELLFTMFGTQMKNHNDIHYANRIFGNFASHTFLVPPAHPQPVGLL